MAIEKSRVKATTKQIYRARRITLEIVNWMERPLDRDSSQVAKLSTMNNLLDRVFVSEEKSGRWKMSRAVTRASPFLPAVTSHRFIRA